jgi:CRP/FNR family transcriptional regulator
MTNRIMITEERFLEKYPFLNDDNLVQDILSVGKYQKISANEILIDLGQRITHFPLIIEGSIKILREDSEGREVFLYYVDSGNTCAATVSCCLNDKVSNVRAIIDEDAELLNIPIENMDKWITQYSSWRRYIFQSFSSRFEDMLNAIDQLAFKKMDERIIGYLNNTAKHTKSNIIKMSHQDIAIDLNTSREVVSRLLKQLEQEGVLLLGRGKIELT